MYIILCIVLQYIYQYTTILPVVLLLAIMYVYRYGTVGIQYHSSTDHNELQGFTASLSAVRYYYYSSTEPVFGQMVTMAPG